MNNSGDLRRHPVYVLLLPILILFGGTLRGQTDTSKPEIPFIIFSGASNAEGQSSNRQGVGQELPGDLFRWRVYPTITLFEVPLNLRLLLSTEQDNRRQRINSFRLGFSLDSRALWRVVRTRAREWLSRPENSETMATVRRIDTLTARLADSVMRDALGRGERIAASADTTIPVISQTLASIRSAQRVATSINDERDSILAAGDSTLRLSESLATMTARESPRGPEDVDRVNDVIEGEGFIKSFERIFHNFTRFGVGVNYPVYTPMTMDGIPVTGIDFEYSPSSQSLYAALAIGRSQTSIQTGDTALAYHRNVYAGRIGYGRRRGSHVHLTALYATDDVESIDSAYRSFLTPEKNLVLGIDLGIPIIPDIMQIDAELSGSILTVDVLSPDLNDGDVPKVVSDVVQPKIGTHGDWTLSFGGSLAVPGTGVRLRGSFKRVGAGYRTLGAPRIRTDYERVEARADGRLWRNRIGWGLSARSERDNLLAWKRATTRTTSLGLVASLVYPNYPTLTLSVTPVFQTNDASDSALQIDNTITVISATSAYSFRIGSMINAVTLSLSSQGTRTLERDFNLGSNAVTLADALILPIPLSIAGSLTYSWPLNALSEVISRRLGVDLNATYAYDDVWRSTVGTMMSNEVDRNSKVVVYARTGFPVWKFGDIELRAEKTLYDDSIDGGLNYDEVVLRAGLASRW